MSILTDTIDYSLREADLRVMSGTREKLLVNQKGRKTERLHMFAPGQVQMKWWYGGGWQSTATPRNPRVNKAAAKKKRR